MVAFDPAHVVGTGGAIGALLRYAVSTRIDEGEYPLATLAVNVLGSFLLGLVIFAGLEHEFVLFFGTGLCGSFTTFSSFSFETVRLWEEGKRRLAAANAFGNLAGALLALGLAWMVLRLVVS